MCNLWFLNKAREWKDDRSTKIFIIIFIIRVTYEWREDPEKGGNMRAYSNPVF